MKKIRVLYLLCIMLFFAACYKNSLEALSNPGGCNSSGMSYSKDIRPIISMHCNINGCHNADAVETFPLVTYDQLKQEAERGILVKVINHDPDVPAMPKNVSKLPDCYIKQITSWVNAGALNN